MKETESELSSDKFQVLEAGRGGACITWWLQTEETEETILRKPQQEEGKEKEGGGDLRGWKIKDFKFVCETADNQNTHLSHYSTPRHSPQYEGSSLQKLKESLESADAVYRCPDVSPPTGSPDSPAH